ncbi:MAG: D-alanyl-D-alanine carboxypeptidase [Candidatus Pacebacteria bacterium]|nr:D-alanyl-D-alanine carboxypeptidase [Candidatus Paceibacterota bacterium]
MNEHNPATYLFWSTLAIVIGILFAAGAVEIVEHERLMQFSFGNKETLISPEKLKPEISPQVSAESYIISSLTTGKVLSAQNAEEVLPIASLTKLVTAVVALDVIPQAKIKITDEDIRVEGNTGKLAVGEIFSTKELLYPLLMVSSNDAAAALARQYGKAQFVARMNAWAWSIGAINTAFIDPAGLSYGNVSNTKDMIKIISWIQKNRPEILEITRLKTQNVRMHAWTNKIPFLNMSEYAGGKNGFTDEAQRTSVSLFSYPELGKDFEKFVIIVLKSDDRNKDVLALLHSIVVK